MLDVLDGDGHDLVGDEGANAQVDEVVRDRTSKERASAENLMVSVADCCSVRGGKRKLSGVGACVRPCSTTNYDEEGRNKTSRKRRTTWLFCSKRHETRSRIGDDR